MDEVSGGLGFFFCLPSFYLRIRTKAQKTKSNGWNRALGFFFFYLRIRTKSQKTKSNGWNRGFGFFFFLPSFHLHIRTKSPKD
jgi:hypothetical protein